MGILQLKYHDLQHWLNKSSLMVFSRRKKKNNFFYVLLGGTNLFRYRSATPMIALQPSLLDKKKKTHLKKEIKLSLLKCTQNSLVAKFLMIIKEIHNKYTYTTFSKILLIYSWFNIFV